MAGAFTTPLGIPQRVAAQALPAARLSSHCRSTASRSMLAQSTQLKRPYSTGSGAKRFSYHLAASFIAKDRPYDPLTHVYNFSPYQRIQQDPRTPQSKRRASRPESGHDAFFAGRINDTDAIAFGVADGVGGWMDSGVDPADFSHGLCGYMAMAAYGHHPDTKLPSARSILQQGYDILCRDKTVRAGGSTACVGVVSPDGTLDLANLGDSGCLHLRLNAVHWYSEAQTHAFNTPFQLSLVPPKVQQRMAYFGGSQLCDLPRDADVSQHDLRHGDVIVFATDGVLDNLFNQDVLRVASRVMTSTGAWKTNSEGGVSVADELIALTEARENEQGKLLTLQNLLATEITGAAKSASVNTRVDGPFAKQVQKYYPQENWKGGKVDDICVVAAVVCEEGKGLRSKL